MCLNNRPVWVIYYYKILRKRKLENLKNIFEVSNSMHIIDCRVIVKILGRLFLDSANTKITGVSRVQEIMLCVFLILYSMLTNNNIISSVGVQFRVIVIKMERENEQKTYLLTNFVEIATLQTVQKTNMKIIKKKT